MQIRDGPGREGWTSEAVSIPAAYWHGFATRSLFSRFFQLVRQPFGIVADGCGEVYLGAQSQRLVPCRNTRPPQFVFETPSTYGTIAKFQS